MAETPLVPTPSGEGLAGVVEGVARLRLNRPRAINALTSAMVADLRRVLAAWADDDAVTRVVIDGAGERGLCAGADVRAQRDRVLAGDLTGAERFWADEYALFADVRHYPKPVEARQDGIVMGGGIGLSAAASDRVVRLGATLAMPETQIGFAPDAGAMHWLSRAGAFGLHLALTGATTGAAGALAVGFSDRCEGEPDPLPTMPWLSAYEAGDPVAIAEALAAHDDVEARAAAADLRARSPLAVWVAWRAWQTAGAMDWDEVLAQDHRIACATLRNPDFVEGVRAQLVDKDRAPRWRHASLADVTEADLAPFLG